MKTSNMPPAESMQHVQSRIRAYIAESFLDAERAESFRDESDLLQLLDSLQILRVVVQLESWFGITVADSELTIENFGSVERIAAFVAGK